MSAPETCATGGCDRDATHEARADDREPWRPLCKSHALSAFEVSESVRTVQRETETFAADGRGIRIERVLGQVENGGSCALCGGDYRGRPYRENRGVRVLAEAEPGVVEPFNLCPSCREGER